MILFYFKWWHDIWFKQILQFLSSLHLMDYSLIVGIHDREQEDENDGNFPMPSGADEEELDEEDGDVGGSGVGGGDQVCLSLIW